MGFTASSKLEREMARANSYEEWKAAAIAYDKHKGHERWRHQDSSSQYDHVSIRHRLDRLRALRSRHDYRGLLFSLNEGIHGNMGGMGKASLYGRAMFGTKQLIGDYIDEVVDTLELLASPEVDNITFEEKLDFFRRAHHCFGASALMMSSSGTLLFFHAGVVKALAEEGLLPNIISGSSGGAIVGSLISSYNDEELQRFMDPNFLVQEFAQESTGLVRRLVKPEELYEMIERLIPDQTFEQAYKRSGRMLNVSIAPAETHQTSRLLSATTSPNVCVQSAVMASSAVPGVFPPVSLQARDNLGERQPYLPTRKWVDGAMSDDLPAKRLARLYGVNHYIVSQTSPHVLPFVTDGLRQQGAIGLLRSAGRRTAREWITTGVKIANHTLPKHSRIENISGRILSFINQDYVGDINIFPRNRFPNPLKVLSMPTAQEIQTLVREGERSAWLRMEMIRVQTRVGKTLEKILQDYEAEHINHQATVAAGAG